MSARRLARKVLVIGWDAADWKVITPLIDAGKMPHLQSMLEQGVMGNLATIFPVLSPMLWTSIATGKRAFKHGIHGFAEPDPETQGVRPITNLGRRCKAVWNILNQNGLRSNVVGWWPSHPAEPINGVMVSNHFQQMTAPAGEPWPMAPGTVHPARLFEALKNMRVHPAELEPAQLLPFVPRAAEVDLSKDQRIASVAKILAETAGVQAAATAIMQLEPWDFMGVYFDAIDHFSHGFMQYRAPRLEWINEHDFEIYKDVVDTAYQFHDLMLGAMLKLVGDETTVILVSDHGFHPDHLRPHVLPNEPAGAADEHRPFGVFAIKGPGIKRDALLHGATLLDITPTILSLFGLPTGRDMDGKVLLGAFEHTPEVDYIDSWDPVAGDAGLHPEGVRVDPLGAHQAMEQLVELGYVEKPDEDKQLTVARTVRELEFNLARDYFGAGRYPQAISLFQELWERYPEESRFGVKLVESYLAMGQGAEGRAALDRLVERKRHYAKLAQDELVKWLDENKDKKPEDLDPAEHTRLRQLQRRAGTNEAALAYLRGRLLQVDDKHEQALAEFQQAEQVQMHSLPSLYRSVGESLLALRRFPEAEEQFRKMLQIDPVNPQARLGLGRCLLGTRRPRLALIEVLAALGLEFHNPLAHYCCGVALRWLGRRDEAVQAFETALQQNPVFPDAHRRLAAVLLKLGRRSEAAEHQRLAVAARQRIADFRAGKALPEDDDLEVDASLAYAATFGNLPNAAAQPPLGNEVVIVSGLPRSGTSMMMQMLAAGGVPVLSDGVRSADEDNPRGYYELEEAKKLASDNSWLPRARGKAVKIVAQLLPNLPPSESYRIIFMQRALAEVVDSQEAMLKRLGRDDPTRSKRRLARTYLDQIAGVRRILEANPGRVAVLVVDYHEALANPARVVSPVNEFLGGTFDVQAMAKAVEPSLRRQFRTA